MFAIWLDKRFKPFSDKSMMIGQTLYRLNAIPAIISLAKRLDVSKNDNGVSKNGVYEPFSYRFSNVFVDKKKIGAATVYTVPIISKYPKEKSIYCDLLWPRCIV